MEKLNLALSCRPMMQAALVSRAFADVDLGDIDDSRHQDFYSIIGLLREVGSEVRKLHFQGAGGFFCAFKYEIDPITRPFTNVQDLRITDVNTCFNLRFLDVPLPHLRNLTLSAMRCSTRDFITHVPRVGGQLEELTLAHNPHLKKDDILHISQYCRQLRYLDITETDDMSPFAVGTILYNCPHMRAFFFSSTYDENLAEDWIEVLCKRYPHIIVTTRTTRQLQMYKEYMLQQMGF